MKDVKYLHDEIKRRDDDYRHGWDRTMSALEWLTVGLALGFLIWVVI